MFIRVPTRENRNKTFAYTKEGALKFSENTIIIWIYYYSLIGFRNVYHGSWLHDSILMT